MRNEGHQSISSDETKHILEPSGTEFTTGAGRPRRYRKPPNAFRWCDIKMVLSDMEQTQGSPAGCLSGMLHASVSRPRYSSSWRLSVWLLARKSMANVANLFLEPP